MAQDVASIIDTLGGIAVVAGSLGLPQTTVGNWKARGSIPAKHWPGLVDLGRSRGAPSVTADALMTAHARSRPTATPAQDAA